MNEEQRSKHLLDVVDELKKIVSIDSIFLSDGGKYYFTIRKTYCEDKHLDKTKWKIEQHEVMYALQQQNGNKLHRTQFIKHGGAIWTPKQVADDLRRQMLKDSAPEKKRKSNDMAVGQYSFL